jgi:tetratricopeptide (TPR) repeat protein
MRRIVKLRLIKGAVLLAVASMAIAFYLGKDGRRSDKSPAMAAHGNGRMPTNAAGPLAGNQHEKQMLTKILEKKPDHVPVLLKLAQIESEDGHLHEAAGRLRTILKKEPDNPDANLELGKVLFKLGDVRGSIQLTEGILKKNPNHEDALYNMGAICANTGDRKQAMEYWNRLAALHSDSGSAKMAQQMMRRLEADNP